MQRMACLATLRLLPQENILRLCSHRSCCPGLIESQVLLPSSEQLFHAVLASHTCTARTRSTQGTGITVGVNRLSQHPSQPEASPSLCPCIPTPCRRLALVLPQCGHADPVQGAQSVMPSCFQGCAQDGGSASMGEAEGECSSASEKQDRLIH